LTRLAIADIVSNMKTIAMTIDEPTLKRIDRLTAGDNKWKSRSEVIRQAVHRFVSDLERADEEAHEREVFRRNAARLDRQAAALIQEQAKP
jgi:Arc/MetJ-type ribon-helix-helix transcriptional regulator